MVREQILEGRYRLVRQIGEGGMGHVWQAQDDTLGRPIAVKVISLLAGGGNRGEEARARFLREARITARLQHPNIVTVHDLGETGVADNRVPFLVMELVRGEGLDAMLGRGAVTLPDAARWGAQICDALADAHDAGIMHRDIKPSNIVITSSGNVKVLDFGIARAADPYATADRLTQTGFIVGTPPYMAPEQARGHPEPRSDLYALGCLLFELITGRLPFQAPDTVGYLSAHLTQEPPAPSSVSADIPSAWDDLVLRLLCKDPDQRYPNAVDVAGALRDLDRTPAAPTAYDPTRRNTAPGTESNRASPRTSRSDEASTGDGFAVSWTGEEPLSAYTDRTGATDPSGAKVAIWGLGLVLAGAAGLWITWLVDPATVTFGDTSNPVGHDDRFHPIDILGLAGVVAGFVGLLVVLGSAIVGWQNWVIRPYTDRTGWSLRVDPKYIVTTGVTGRREYTWDQIQGVTIKQIEGRGPHKYTGVHLRLKRADATRTLPAGWPYPHQGSLKSDSDHGIPICVLGPMTERQRTELNQTLARYGGQRWQTPTS